VTEEEIMALESGDTIDLVAAAQAGWRVDKPSMSINTAMQLEDLAENDGNHLAYTNALEDIIKLPGDNAVTVKWKMAHATPMQRTQAFLMVYALD